MTDQEKIAELLSLLREAQAELEWWLKEHYCCRGHEGDLLERIAEALRKHTT